MTTYPAGLTYREAFEIAARHADLLSISAPAVFAIVSETMRACERKYVQEPPSAALANALESALKEFDWFIDFYELNECLVDKYKDRLYDERKVLAAYRDKEKS